METAQKERTVFRSHWNYYGAFTGSITKMALAINLMISARKGLSSIQFAKRLGVTQKMAWHMEYRIRKACESNEDIPLKGDIEIDETYIGGQESNKHASKKLNQ